MHPLKSKNLTSTNSTTAQLPSLMVNYPSVNISLNIEIEILSLEVSADGQGGVIFI